MDVDDEMKDYDLMLNIPDHFHASMHVLIDAMDAINKIVNTHQFDYNNIYAMYARGLEKTWSNGRMDLSAQDMFKFQSKFVFPSANAFRVTVPQTLRGDEEDFGKPHEHKLCQ
jgi:hypothetical protein